VSEFRGSSRLFAEMISFLTSFPKTAHFWRYLPLKPNFGGFEPLQPTSLKSDNLLLQIRLLNHQRVFEFFELGNPKLLKMAPSDEQPE
jgi:hypothetical protein